MGARGQQGDQRRVLRSTTVSLRPYTLVAFANDAKSSREELEVSSVIEQGIDAGLAPSITLSL